MADWPAIRLAIFGIATLLLAYISRASLQRPGTHGFIRFFVWELILALTLINAPAWFREPFAWHQLVSWSLLTLSLIPLTLGVQALRRYGKPSTAKRADPELVAIERTTRLVREGIFRYIRHPMYTSLLLLAWGLFFKLPSMVGFLLAGLSTAGLVRMAIVEEAECSHVFGDSYLEYMKGTRRFIPHVF